MTDQLFSVMAFAAVSIGSLHALAPDHWVPFAALARAQRWTLPRTAGVTALCGIGHVTVSVLLGLLGLAFGVAVLETFGRRMESMAGLLLVGFGLAYAIWGLRRSAGAHFHGHVHAHYDHVHDASRTTAWTLFLLFCADPCVAVIPLLFATAPLGVLRTVVIVALYELATVGTMVLLVVPATRAVVKATQKRRWLDHYGDATAGAIIACVGLAVAALGW